MSNSTYAGGYFVQDAQPTAAPQGLAGADVDVDDASDENQNGGPTVEPTDDGGAIVDFSPESPNDPIDFTQHGANLAEAFDDPTLAGLASDLLEEVEADLSSRRDWEEWYLEGVRLLGLKVEERTQPFQGASAIYHPMLTEAVVRFQATARAEMLPAEGPVKTQIVGRVSQQLSDQSERVRRAFNYYLTETAAEYYPDYDQMLLYLPIAGSTFKRVYECPIRGRPVSEFVTPDDLIVSYTTSSLFDAPRVTHRQFPSQGYVRRLQLSGYYRDVKLAPAIEERSAVQEAVDDIEGRTPDLIFNKDERRCTYTVFAYLDLPDFRHLGKNGKPSGIPLPYKIVIERDARTILRIERNWEPGDAAQSAVLDIVHYQYLPGLGFYGLGLTHLIGGASKAATSLLRQLIDAGTLSNLPGGLVVKGMRVEDNDIPVNPGEFREIETNGLPIGSAVMALPYKEPSSVLAQLLGNLIEEAKQLAGTADISVGEGQSQAPVGTTVALIDQATKVMSSVHKRLHVSMRLELRLLAKYLARDPQRVWPYRGVGPQGIGAATAVDFADVVDVVPVSDPNIPSQTQRVMRMQALLMLAQSAPQIYDLRNVHQRMLQVLDIDPTGLLQPPPQQAVPLDPMSENVMALKGAPLAVGPAQDDRSHIQAHMQFMMTPGVINLPGAQPALMSHMADHLASMYRKQVQMQTGMQAPPPGQPLPPDVENKIAVMVAQASQAITQTLTQVLGPIVSGGAGGGHDQAATMAAQAQMEANKVKMADIQEKGQDAERKIAESQMQANADMTKTQMQMQNDAAERASREKLANMRFMESQLRSSQIGASPGG